MPNCHPFARALIYPAIRAYSLSLLLILGGSFAPVSLAEQKATSQSFLPTWKLLSPSQKKAFLSGYLHSLQDAAQVTELAIEHIRANPDQAIQSLEQVRSLYETRHVQPEVLVALINDFYSDPDNKNAPLSRAVSSGSQRIQR